MTEKRIVNLKTELLAAPYIREILLQGGCSMILPFSLVQGKDFCFGVYHTEGYLPLRLVEKLNAAQVLTLAEKILRLIDTCRDHLLFPEEYVLNSDTLYVCRDFSEVKLLYRPAGEKNRTRSDLRDLQELLQELKPITTGNGRHFLRLLQEMMAGGDRKTDRLIGCLENWKEEIAFPV